MENKATFKKLELSNVEITYVFESRNINGVKESNFLESKDKSGFTMTFLFTCDNFSEEVLGTVFVENELDRLITFFDEFQVWNKYTYVKALQKTKNDKSVYILDLGYAKPKENKGLDLQALKNQILNKK